MALITRDDVRKLAHISCIEVHEDELDMLMSDLEEVLSYASSLKKIAEECGDTSVIPHPINVMRADEIQPYNAHKLVGLAPKHEENFFVVPVIVKQ